MNKLTFISFLLFLSITTRASDGTVELNWKINPGETLHYYTVMEIIDTSSFNLSFFEQQTAENTQDVQAFTQQTKEFIQAIGSLNLISSYTHTDESIIEFTVRSTQKIDPDFFIFYPDAKNILDDIGKLAQKQNSIVLRGSVYPTGKMHSFWVKPEQRNLISLLSELPAEPVKIGDSWELDINFINNDEKFQGKSAGKEATVTLKSIEVINDEKIALLSYHIIEYVEGLLHFPNTFRGKDFIETMMKFQFTGYAGFSIDKGKWVFFDGLLNKQSQDMTQTQSYTKLSLIPIEK